MGVWFLALLGAVTPLADRFQACNARAARIEPAAMDCLSEMADEAARVGDAGIEAKARYSISWLEMWLADFQRGAREGERAHELFRKLPDGIESRFCGATLGYHLRELGEPRRSLALIGESIERTHAAHDQWRESFARSFRARTLLWMGEFEEAEAEARRSLEIAQAVGEPLAIAVANWPLGVALQEQGRPREAIPTQEAGAAAAMKSGMPQFAFVMRLNIAQMSLEVDDTVRVEQELMALERDVEAAGLPGLMLYVQGLRGDLYARQGRYREALPYYQRQLAIPSPWAQRQALAGKARALRALRDPGALDTYRELVRFIDEHRERAGADQQRASFLSANAAPYRELVAALFDQDGERSANEAFAVAERGRARSLLDVALGAPGDTQVPASLDAASVQGLLEPGEALLEYSVSDEGVFGFALSRSSLRLRKLVPKEQMTDLRQRIALFSTLVESESGPDVIAPGAAALHALLVAPLLAALPEPPRALAISPDGALHQLPFAALLPDANRREFLGAALPLRELPAGSLLAQRSRTPAPLPALVVGDPLARPGEPLQVSLLRDGFGALPQSAYEARTAANSLGPGTVLLLGADASEARVKREEPGRFRVLHFATHGFADEQVPLRSALVLNAGDGEDGLLEAQEILKLPLHADLVVLSGCRTGAGRLRPAEGVQSLARAFLLAGARAVVATRWPVLDGGARHLIERFYGELENGADAALALSRARAAQLSRGAPPRDWAGFYLAGARSTLPPARQSRLWLLCIAVLALLGPAVFILVRRRRAGARGQDV